MSGTKESEDNLTSGLVPSEWYQGKLKTTLPLDSFLNSFRVSGTKESEDNSEPPGTTTLPLNSFRVSGTKESEDNLTSELVPSEWYQGK